MFLYIQFCFISFKRTLSPKEICHACAFKSPFDPTHEKLPEFRAEYNCGRKYQPSYNVAPTDVTPVLVSSAHFDDDSSASANRCLVPMMWGMIPFWHQGAYQKHGLTTNNCRLETMLTSRLYGTSFRKGQRCVIVCEGFYEWQTTKGAKSSEREAYYCYMPQEGGVLKQQDDDGTEDTKHRNLLHIAGLFDVWSDENGDNMYSYSVITFESVENFAWLHHRSPAILETDQQVAVISIFQLFFYDIFNNFFTAGLARL